MLARLVCFVRRQHDYRLSQGGGRLYLSCYRCGSRTPGWETHSRPRVNPSRSEPLRLLLEDSELNGESDTTPTNARPSDFKPTLPVALGASTSFRLSLE
jgi:hypothetical protein